MSLPPTDGTVEGLIMCIEYKYSIHCVLLAQQFLLVNSILVYFTEICQNSYHFQNDTLPEIDMYGEKC